MTGAQPRPLTDLVAVEEERLTGAELRRLTARVRAHNLPPEPGRVVADVGEVAITVALVVLYLWGFGTPVRELLSSDATGTGLGHGLIQAMALALALVGGAVVATRLGPAGLPAAGVRWWLPTPPAAPAWSLPRWCARPSPEPVRACWPAPYPRCSSAPPPSPSCWTAPSAARSASSSWAVRACSR
nr:hypothetical protein GCM10025730_13550 [Promicromonospora thailandica]